MRTWILLMIIPALIIYRSVYSLFLLPGTHSDLYNINLYNFHESAYNVVIAILLLCNIRIKKEPATVIIKIGAAFCFAIAVYMLYGFLPNWVGVNIKYFTIPFYLVGLLTAIAIIYCYCFVLNPKKLS